MYLSLFLKKRKADLLQNVWKEIMLSRENVRTTMVRIKKKKFTLIETMYFYRYII